MAEPTLPTTLPGSIKGYIDLINGHGINEFRGVPYYRNSMDILASIARVLNELNTIDPGNPKPLFSSADGGQSRQRTSGYPSSGLMTPPITTTIYDANAGDNILRMISAIDSEIVFYRDATDDTWRSCSGKPG